MRYFVLIWAITIATVSSETTDIPKKNTASKNRRNFDLLPQPLVLGPFQALPAVNHFARIFFDGSVNGESKTAFGQFDQASSGFQDGFTPSTGVNWNNQQFDATAATGTSYAPGFNADEYSTINAQDISSLNSGINSAANIDITTGLSNGVNGGINTGTANDNINTILSQDTGKYSTLNNLQDSSANNGINFNNINTHDVHDDCNDYHGYHTLQGVYQTIQDSHSSYEGYQDSYQAPLIPAQPQPAPAPQVITKEVRVPVPVPQPYPVTVEKKVPVPVPQPYPVQVVKNVPYRVEVKVPVAVPRPYPVHVTRKVPVYVRVPQPVRVEVPRPYPVEKRVPVPVRVKVPVYIKVPVPVPAENGGDHVDHIEIHHVGGRIHGHFVGSTSHFHGGHSDFHGGIIRDASEVHNYNHGNFNHNAFNYQEESYYQGHGIPATVYGPPGYQPGTPISKRSQKE